MRRNAEPQICRIWYQQTPGSSMSSRPKRKTAGRPSPAGGQYVAPAEQKVQACIPPGIAQEKAAGFAPAAVAVATITGLPI